LIAVILIAAHSEPWWMITRITGIAAMVGLVAVAGYGVLLAARLGRYPARTKRRLHRRLSRLVLGVVALHIGAALLDRHHIPPGAVLVPFLSPVRTVAAGLGSLALWGLLLVMLTVAARRWFRRSWRVLHYLAYPATGLALAHSFLGSDPILVASSLALCVALLLVGSIWPRRHLRRPPKHPGGSTLPLLSALTRTRVDARKRLAKPADAIAGSSVSGPPSPLRGPGPDGSVLDGVLQ
jgi:sulfoxide reductase heme-binding subunit YedZ